VKAPAAFQADGAPAGAAAPAARVCNVMSVDLEDYFQVSAFADHIPFEAWGSHALRVGDNTRRLLDLFEGAGVTATFFCLGWIGERCPELVREVADRGHEVASHGYRHRLVYDLSPAEFRDDVTRTKAILEDASGREVRGFRAASFSIVPSCFWAMDVLGEAGYTYDSSMFPTHHDRYGTPGIPLLPHRWQGTGIVEVPMSVVPLFGLPVPVGGGGYLRHFPYGFTEWAIRRLNERHGRPVITYLHPWEIDPGQPVQPVGWVTRARHYRGIPSFWGKMVRLLTDFRFASAGAWLADAGLLPAGGGRGSARGRAPS
jgi:polysaccharide deacetylase family protein (PEP-CTERM system associated)